MIIEGKNIDDSVIAKVLTDLWAPLTDEQRQYLIDHITLTDYKRNEMIYTEGENPTSLFCLIKGKVKIFKEGIGGRHQIVRMVKPHSYFGYRAGFMDEAYTTSASAIEASKLGLIPIPVVKHLITENNQLAICFIKHLANLLGRADEQTVNLTQKHIRGRLAEALLRLKEKYGTESDGKTLNIQVSREDLASLSSMATCNAIRTLSAFAEEELVILDGRSIAINDEEKLKSISVCG